MNKITDEIKKIAKDNDYDLNKFESVFDAVAEIEEKSNKDEKEIKKLNNDIIEKDKSIETLTKENEDYKKTTDELNQKVTDLKIKYIDRFNEPPSKNKNENDSNEDITISDLFKEE